MRQRQTEGETERAGVRDRESRCKGQRQQAQEIERTGVQTVRQTAGETETAGVRDRESRCAETVRQTVGETESRCKRQREQV